MVLFRWGRGDQSQMLLFRRLSTFKRLSSYRSVTLSVLPSGGVLQPNCNGRKPFLPQAVANANANSCLFRFSFVATCLNRIWICFSVLRLSRKQFSTTSAAPIGEKWRKEYVFCLHFKILTIAVSLCYIVPSWNANYTLLDKNVLNSCSKK